VLVASTVIGDSPSHFFWVVTTRQRAFGVSPIALLLANSPLVFLFRTVAC
jgi:hypothetical protein